VKYIQQRPSNTTGKQKKRQPAGWLGILRNHWQPITAVLSLVLMTLTLVATLPGATNETYALIDKLRGQSSPTSFHRSPSEPPSPSPTSQRPETSATPEPSPSPPVSNENITVENNEEFRALIESPQPDDTSIEQFVAKYKGRAVEFDGNVASMGPHNTYKTRFDFLIYPGDYSTTSVYGPSFQFANCAYYNLNLTGDNIPNSTSAGQNLHIIAKIIDFNSKQQLLHLEPIATSTR